MKGKEGKGKGKGRRGREKRREKRRGEKGRVNTLEITTDGSDKSHLWFAVPDPFLTQGPTGWCAFACSSKQGRVNIRDITNA